MEIVADNIRKAEEMPGRFRKEFHIFFVPRKSLLCERKLTVSTLIDWLIDWLFDWLIDWLIDWLVR